MPERPIALRQHPGCPCMKRACSKSSFKGNNFSRPGLAVRAAARAGPPACASDSSPCCFIPTHSTVGSCPVGPHTCRQHSLRPQIDYFTLLSILLSVFPTLLQAYSLFPGSCVLCCASSRPPAALASAIITTDNKPARVWLLTLIISWQEQSRTRSNLPNTNLTNQYHCVKSAQIAYPMCEIRSNHIHIVWYTHKSHTREFLITWKLLMHATIHYFKSMQMWGKVAVIQLNIMSTFQARSSAGKPAALIRNFL